MNLTQLAGEYQEKQRLQYLLFHEGLVYDKENEMC